MTNILLIAGRYHLGDNPGVFQNANYVGYSLELPFRKTWIDPQAVAVTFVFSTTDVETWAEWQGHSIQINGTEIGTLRDPSDTLGETETFRISVPVNDFNAILNGDDRFTLGVKLGVQASTPGMSDDFILTRIETDGTLAAALGWK